MKCKNFELCYSMLPKGGDLCPTCISFQWGELETRHTDERCRLCYIKKEKEFRFPACHHWFCISCMRDIFLWDERNYELSPVPYGCPPCPKLCPNPIKGKQCNCLEYLDTKDIWQRDHPEAFLAWTKDEEESMNEWVFAESSAFGRGECPVCKAVVEQKLT